MSEAYTKKVTGKQAWQDAGSKRNKVYARYGELWRIRGSFWLLKHTMAIRPIFLCTARRVKAHVAICFAASAILRMLRYLYNTRYGAEHPLSEARILAELRNVETSVLQDRNTNT